MTSLTVECALSLVQLAADYTTQLVPEKVRQNAHPIAAKNASLFGKILLYVDTFLRSTDGCAVSTLMENLSTLKLPKSGMEAYISILQEVRKQSSSNPSVASTHLPSLAGVRWRVDITISSSQLSRVLEPNIIMEWQLSNGKKVMFEVSVAKFHKLRYYVASILKEMISIQMKLNSIKS